MTKLTNFDSFVETDYSRFDMTISEDWVKQVEHSLLSIPFDLEQPEHSLYRLALDLLPRIKGVSSFGLLYHILGTRCSGDAHTSIGNGLVNAFNTWVCLRDLPPGAWSSKHEGDDGFVAYQSEYHQVIKDRLSQLGCMGFTVKMKFTTNIQEVEFCGRFHGVTPTGLRSFCDPLRALAKFNVTLSTWKLRPLLLAKALSYHHTDARTPVIGPLCRALITILSDDGVQVDTRAYLDTVKSRYLAGDSIKFVANLGVDDHLRGAFSDRSGITVSQQLQLEGMFASWAELGVIPAQFPKIKVHAQDYELSDRNIFFTPDNLPASF